MRLPKDLRELFASEGSKTTPTDAGPQWGQSFSYDGTDHYVYDPANRRVWKQEPTRELIYFYEVDGTLLTTYGDNGYFAGKLIWQGGAAPAAASSDRLGSLTANCPYGEEYTPPTGQDTFKFATYYRDQTTTPDYAQRSR